MRRSGVGRTGFTLIELLVVIAIITVLVAIALPVFSRARQKARQTACMANLHSLAVAIRMYRMDEGHYPSAYDPVTGAGGLNDLYPTYVSDRRTFICPDDPTTLANHAAKDGSLLGDLLNGILNSPAILELEYVTWDNLMPTPERLAGASAEEREVLENLFAERYSSYNSLYNYLGYVPNRHHHVLDGVMWLPEGDDPNAVALDVMAGETWSVYPGTSLAWVYMLRSWQLDLRTGFSYNPDELLYGLAQQIYWHGYLNEYASADQWTRMRDGMGRALWDVGNPFDPVAYDYTPYGQPSAVFPGLINRNATDSTIITRCMWHRRFRDVEHDIALRLDGSATFLPGLDYDWAVQPK